MHVDHLWLTDFRSYEQAEMGPAPAGVTVITGPNGEGKTNLLEAVAYLGNMRSMRGSPVDALVRVGADQAVVRAEGASQSRRLLIEAEIHSAGRDRVQVNGQPLRRARDLAEAIQVTVFAPDDLSLVKGGPSGRRQYLDDLAVALHPKLDATMAEVDRVLKQRTALLKSAGPGRSRYADGKPGDLMFTLDVWDQKLAAAGEELARARDALATELQPLVADAYRSLAAGASRPGLTTVSLAYQRSWAGSLADALQAARAEDLRRGVTTVGPHRDEMDLSIGGMPARSHASQGEQRCTALALRLAGHALVAERVGASPILLLDDVFSELDAARSEALLGCLPPGQALLTTTGAVPPGADVRCRLRVENGKVLS